MPTYEYGCPNGHHFEKIQKITDRAGARCPVCGATAKRMISGGAGLVFKGSGFYITDYGKDGKGPRKEKTEAAEKPAEKPAAKSDAKADGKPAKAETRPGAKASE